MSGSGYAVIDGVKKKLQSGDIVFIPIGCKHTIMADTDVKLIEVQLGKEINVEDKKNILFLFINNN